MSRFPRLFVPHSLQLGGEIILEDAERHRLVRTLRLHRGDSVQVFNGTDGEWLAVIREPGPPLRLEILQGLAKGGDPGLAVTLVLGLTKSGSIEVAVQKAVEVGAVTLIPLLTRYGVSRPDERQTDNKLRRLQRIAVEAAQQCGRCTPPLIHAPVEWKDLAALLPDSPRLLFWEEERNHSVGLMGVPDPGDAVTLLVGPEGGLTMDEVQYAREALGFVCVTLGPRILRAETAAIVAVAACQMLWGDMG
ncbi:MAG: 16S rRNA (uracil(1498)-N(3))-methyltransferase [Magnetococcus sp. YQC-5]